MQAPTHALVFTEVGPIGRCLALLAKGINSMMVAGGDGLLSYEVMGD